MQQRMALEQALLISTKALAASPEQLPAAVSLRYSRGELTVKDIPALMKVGMPATCRKLQNAARDAAMQKMAEDMEERRALRELNQHKTTTSKSVFAPSAVVDCGARLNMARKKSSGRPSDYEFKSLKLAGSDRPARPITHPQHRPRFGCATAQAKKQLQDLYDQEDAKPLLRNWKPSAWKARWSSRPPMTCWSRSHPITAGGCDRRNHHRGRPLPGSGKHPTPSSWRRSPPA